MRKRLRAEIRGAVQGVGFRPFVYRLARELDLEGWVVNGNAGVLLEVEGPSARLDRFLTRLADEPPPAAAIDEIRSSRLSPAGYSGFRIEPSEQEGKRTVQVLPDLATCARCRDEVRDPENRRYRYPFTNCTDCGPRFSIVESVPYDRPRTTMKRFTMCDPCREEYENPLDRRFHAQPNACPDCGPQVALRDGGGQLLATADAALERAVTALRDGAIVAVKGLAGYHLMLDARNGDALERLRSAKPRREKPLAVMVRDLEAARELCRLDAAAEALLISAQAPIVLAPRRKSAMVHASVAPGNPYLGVMLAYSPLHQILLDELRFPLVATSGNRKDEPICTDEAEAIVRLAGLAELFLEHDRPIARHADDSVVQVVEGQPRLLRRARGWAPRPVPHSGELPPILAVGAHLKNAVALSVGQQVLVGQHLGDMETIEAHEAFERAIVDLLELYDVQPVALAHDLHPDYTTTDWALRASSGAPGPAVCRRLEGCRLVPVQHHHAHLAACLAENGWDGGEVLGVTWDGTGYGADGTIWGGEFLVGDASSYRRVAHLHPFRLPGGEASIRQPRRTALALLHESAAAARAAAESLPAIRSFRAEERRVLERMLDRGVGAPVTTSAGRLFDGVSALVGLCLEASYDAQAAMALEFAADPMVREAYPIEVAASGEQPDRLLLVDWRPTVAALLDDLRRAEATATISARFHNALAEATLRVAQEVGLETVALSGGCFQNQRLLRSTAKRLREAGFRLLLQGQLPPNDGGISLGQVAVAAARLGRAPDSAAGP
jgi:hydrogenase maturation protein HypF